MTTSLTTTAKDLTVLTKDQAVLVDQVKTYHKGVYVSYEHQIQYAFMAGLTLNALKDSCLHGNAKEAKGLGFMAIREQFLPEISKSAASRYMDFTRLVQEDNATVGNIRPSNLLLENGDLPEKEKASVLKAVYEAADGKSWTAFYRDLNLVRQKKAPSHHPRNPDAKAEIDKPDPETTFLHAVRTDLLMLIDPKETELEEHDNNELREFLTILQAASKRVSALLKDRRSGAQPSTR